MEPYALTDTEIQSARSWYNDHRDYVEALLRFAEKQGMSIWPSAEDARLPNNWKYIHWAWFVKHHAPDLRNLPDWGKNSQINPDLEKEKNRVFTERVRKLLRRLRNRKRHEVI